MGALLRPGDAVLFIDRKDREYLRTLEPGKRVHLRRGTVAADDLIGQAEGRVVRNTAEEPFLVLRPTYAHLIPNLPRQAQVIYPKDIASILISADVFPGAMVLEAGTGSGALTLALVRAVGPSGRVVSYDIRDEHASKARTNVESFFGRVPDWLDLRIGDVSAAEPGPEVDRVILDLPEPWRVVPRALDALRPGGIFCCYLPTVPQVSQVTEALRGAGFTDVTTTETLVRTWHVEGQSVRPDHRMVAHTGFVTTGRSLGGGEP